MKGILSHLRQASRVLRRRPGFSSVAVVTLAIAIGANAAIFSAVHAVLLKPLPLHDPDRLVGVWEANPRRSTDWLANLAGIGEPESVIAYRFSGNFFGILGVPARLGRTLEPGDAHPGHDRVVVLADSLWRRRFASDPGVIGRPLTLDGESYTVVGVMPPGFGHPPRVEIWAPLVLEGASATAAAPRFIRMIGRLRPGVHLAAAGNAVAGVAAARAREDAVNHAGWSAVAHPIASPYTWDVTGSDV